MIAVKLLSHKHRFG